MVNPVAMLRRKPIWAAVLPLTTHFATFGIEVEKPTINISAVGDGARLPERVPAILKGDSNDPIDALVIQPYYTYRLLKNADLTLSLDFKDNEVGILVS